MKSVFFSIMFILIFALPSQSLATLGEPESDLSNESAVYASAKLTNYNCHTLNKHKLQLKQFATKGIVFAVTWSGRTHPDLPAVLGRHFSEYQAAYREAKRTRRGHSPIEIELGGIHVEQGGTPRALYGRVWLTALLPSQVNTDEIR